MCASIHLSFKMEALNTAPPTEGGFRPVLSRQTHQRSKYNAVVFNVCIILSFLFFGNISHENTSDLTPVLVVVIMAFDHQAIWAPH